MRSYCLKTGDWVVAAVYREILDALWVSGGALPADPEDLTDILGPEPETIERCVGLLVSRRLGCALKVEGGRLFNERVASDISEAEANRQRESELQRQKGKRSAEVRRERDGTARPPSGKGRNNETLNRPRTGSEPVREAPENGFHGKRGKAQELDSTGAPGQTEPTVQRAGTAGSGVLNRRFEPAEPTPNRSEPASTVPEPSFSFSFSKKDGEESPPSSPQAKTTEPAAPRTPKAPPARFDERWKELFPESWTSDDVFVELMEAFLAERRKKTRGGYTEGGLRVVATRLQRWGRAVACSQLERSVGYQGILEPRPSDFSPAGGRRPDRRADHQPTEDDRRAMTERVEAGRGEYVELDLGDGPGGRTH